MNQNPFNAIDLDEMLAALTPDSAAAILEAVPPGLCDQVSVALADSMEFVTGAMGLGADAIQVVNGAEVADWFRLSARDVLVHWSMETARTCVHNPNPLRPEPVFAAAWRPGLIVCGGCLPLLKVSNKASMTCDGCGHRCAGPESGDPIIELFLWQGDLAFQAGACRICADTSGLRIAADSEPTSQQDEGPAPGW